MAETERQFTRAQQEGIVLALALMQGQYITPDSWLKLPQTSGVGLRPYVDPGGRVGESVLGTLGRSMPQPSSLIDRAMTARPDVASGFLQEIRGMSDQELTQHADTMLRQAERASPAMVSRLFPNELAIQKTQDQTRFQAPINRSSDLRTPPAQSIPYLSMVQEAAKRNGLDPTLLAAMLDWESGWDPKIQGAAGEIGLGQLMPATARGLGVTDRADPRQNIEGAARYLGEQLRANGGDERLALGHYNAGPGGTPVQHYIDSVLAQRGKYSNMSSYVPLGDQSGATAPNLENGRLSNDITTLMTFPPNPSAADMLEYIDKINQTVPALIQQKSQSTDPEDLKWASDAQAAYNGAMGMALKRYEIAQKYGDDNAANTIALMRLRLEENGQFQRSAAEAAKLNFDYYSFDANQRFQLMKYNTIDVPSMQWKQAIDLIDLAHQEMVEQHRMIEGEYNAEEGTRRYEIGRQDAARKFVQEAEQAYTGFLTGNAKAIAEAAKNAGSQFLTYLPYIITEQMKGKPYPGYEPGGAQETLAKGLGIKYTPNNYGDQGIVEIPHPYQAVDDLRSRLGELEQSFPRPRMEDMLTPSTPTQFNYNRPPRAYEPSPLVSSLMGGGPTSVLSGGGGQGPADYYQEDMGDGSGQPSIYDILGQYEVPPEEEMYPGMEY